MNYILTVCIHTFGNIYAVPYEEPAPTLVAYSKGSSTVVVNSGMSSINQVSHYTETGDGNVTA